MDQHQRPRYRDASGWVPSVSTKSGWERTWSFHAGVNLAEALEGSAMARRGASRRAGLPERMGFASARTIEPGRRAVVKEAIVFLSVEEFVVDAACGVG